MSADDRTLNMATGNGGRVWLEPMPVSTGAIPAWGLTPLARLRASARVGNGKGGPATITPADARKIAAALVSWADQADRVAAGR